MDEFGVLTERYGLKPQGKSVPMAQAKRSTAATTTTSTTDQRFGYTGLKRNPASFSSTSLNSSPGSGSLLGDHDFLPSQNSRNSFGLGDDFGFDFQNPATKQSNTSNNSSRNGSSVDLASMLFNSGPKSSSSNSYVVDDLFGGMPVSQNANNDDGFGSFVSSTKQKGSSGDLLGDFSGVAAKLKSSNRNASWDSMNNETGFDDLIPGFGGSSPPPVKRTSVKTTKSTFGSSEEPFFIFESDPGSEFNFSEGSSGDPLGEFSVLNQSGGTKPRGSSNASQPLRPPKPAQGMKADKVKRSGASPIDELEDFAMGRAHNTAYKFREAEDATKKTRQNREDDLESFFGVNARSNSAPKSRATTLDPMFEFEQNKPNRKTSAGASSTAKKASPVTMTTGMDDLSFMFGAASVFGEFEEVAGESEERRRARLERHQRTQDRMARAVADMNQRDRRSENEQEERRRIAEAMDFEIKRWAAGKQGNMRALLASLQQVLWSECGWEPVSLTDLITSGSVKKVYRKATLCVHPDKVQQKGATVEQKYVAEKVFDILKEAWNKFNKEELS